MFRVVVCSDIALDQLKTCDLFAFFSPLSPPERRRMCTVIEALAAKTSSFYNDGNQLTFCQRWIYARFHIQSDHGSSSTSTTHGKLQSLWNFLKLHVTFVKHVYNIKLEHVQVRKLLNHICQNISYSYLRPIVPSINDAAFTAVSNGNVEFLRQIIDAFPDMLWFACYDNKWTLLSYAIWQRQEDVFNLLCEIGAIRYQLESSVDDHDNSILHHAAMLSPSSQLGRVSGAALQMQRELQWFKEVEKIVQPMYKQSRNKEGRTPRELFKEQHKELVEKGEKWMKDMATSCSVVAALIVTMMFSAAFSVPGNHTTKGKSRIVFIISDALTMFSSSASVIVFLGILTSRYKEEDFLKSLPTKLIIGLSTLFFSIATMMVAFVADIVLKLHKPLGWIPWPLIVLASIPVNIFALLQIPLLLQIFSSTYGSGVFYRSN